MCGITAVTGSVNAVIPQKWEIAAEISQLQYWRSANMQFF